MASIPGTAGPGAKFPQWTYNTFSHQVAEVPNAFAKTMAIAATWPNKLIFFTSEAAADAYMASQGGGTDTSHSPIQAGADAASGAGQAAVDAAKKLPTGLAAIGDFFNKLGQGNTWIRVFEFAVGAVLLGIGLNALLKQSTGVDVAGTAVKTAKAVR